MKKLNGFKLSLLAASVAGLGVGCASSGYARYDQDRSLNGNSGMGANVGGIGASASTEIGRDTTYHNSTDYGYRSPRVGYSTDRTTADEGAAQVTVSALSFTPETRADWVNKFPFYNPNWNMRTIETYTFAVPDPKLHASVNTDLPQFKVDLPPGSVFVESAGGAGEVRRVIRHSPNPR